MIEVFWNEYKGEILIAIGTVLLTALATFLTTPRPKRQEWTYRNRIKKLDDMIKQHDKKQLAPVEYLAAEVRAFILNICCQIIYAAILNFLVVLISDADSLFPRFFLPYSLFLAALWSITSFPEFEQFVNPIEYREKLVAKKAELIERGY